MAESPATIRVTHDELATKIIRTGQNLIELGMALREGFDVPVEYTKPASTSADVLRTEGTAEEAERLLNEAMRVRNQARTDTGDVGR